MSRLNNQCQMSHFARICDQIKILIKFWNVFKAFWIKEKEFSSFSTTRALIKRTRPHWKQYMRWGKSSILYIIRRKNCRKKISKFFCKKISKFSKFFRNSLLSFQIFFVIRDFFFFFFLFIMEFIRISCFFSYFLTIN